MSRAKIWYVHCDVCDDEGMAGMGSIDHGGPCLKRYLTHLRNAGWTFGKRDLCPNCNSGENDEPE